MAFYKCVNLDGSNEYVDCGNDASLRVLNNLSVNVWVNCGSQVTGDAIISKFYAGISERCWILYAGPSDAQTLRVIVSDDGSYGASNSKDWVTTNQVLTAGWHMVSMTFATGTLKVYVDGVEIVAWTKTLDPAITSIFAGPNASTGIKIGALTSGTPAAWAGKICNASVWQTAVLSSTDITNLYNGGTPKAPENITPTGGASLLAAWLWETDTTYPTAVDRIGSSDGTMTNMEAGDVQDTAWEPPTGWSAGKVMGKDPASVTSVLSVPIANIAKILGV